MLRGLEKVSCEAALLFTGYNIKRALNVLGFDAMMAKMDEYAAKIGASSTLLPSAAALFAAFHAAAGTLRLGFAAIFSARRGRNNPCLA